MSAGTLSDETGHVRQFVLLATARTGSNLLSSLLSAHPSIKMYGELFNLDTLPKPYLLEALDDPVAYLRRRLEKTQRPECAAVGFKLFYDHLKSDYFDKPVHLPDVSERVRNKVADFKHYIDTNYHWPSLLERFDSTRKYLIDDRDVAIVHLRRRNVLHTLISLKTAFITGRFWRVTNGDEEKTTIHLSPEECQHYFQLVEAESKQADADFADHRVLNVTYEDLADARDDEFRRITRFLGVADVPVSTRMRKQIRFPPSEVVDNYPELKHCFEHTRWGVFFE